MLWFLKRETNSQNLLYFQWELQVYSFPISIVNTFIQKALHQFCHSFIVYFTCFRKIWTKFDFNLYYSFEKPRTQNRTYNQHNLRNQWLWKQLYNITRFATHSLDSILFSYLVFPFNVHFFFNTLSPTHLPFTLFRYFPFFGCVFLLF